MDFLNYLAQLVGYLAMILVAILIVALIVSSFREVYRKSSRYAYKVRKKKRTERRDITMTMWKTGILTHSEAKERLDTLDRLEESDHV